MLPEERPASALVLGAGGGTLLHLLAQRFVSMPIIAVDDDAAMLDLARTAFGPLPRTVTLHQGDALAFVHADATRYDYIAVDLYRAGRLARGVLALPFLRALVARLEPGGGVAFNLFHDELLAQRLAKLERVFDRVRLREAGANAVFFGRTHRRR